MTYLRSHGNLGVDVRCNLGVVLISYLYLQAAVIFFFFRVVIPADSYLNVLLVQVYVCVKIKTLLCNWVVKL